MTIYDPVIHAQLVGTSEYKAPGSLFYAELQIAHTLKCLNRKRFDDHDRVRVRRHPLLIAPPGVGKSSMVFAFLEKCAGAEEFMSYDEEEMGRRPTFIEVGGSGVTWERMRGSSTEHGDLLAPFLTEVDYVVSSEWLSFVGSGTRKEMVRELCRVLEDGKITVALIKMAAANDKKKEAFRDSIEGTGIIYNERHGGMTYEVGSAFIGATTPIGDEDGIDYLKQSGLLSRHSINEWDPGEMTMRAYRRRQYGKPDLPKEAELKAFNLYCFRTPVGFIPYPELEMINDIIDHYHEAYDRICNDSGVSINSVASSRDQTDAAQLLCARASMRAFLKGYHEGAKRIEAIEYTQEDVEWVKKYRQANLVRLYNEAMAMSGKGRKHGELFSALSDYVREHGGPHEVKGSALVDWLKRVKNLKQTAAYERMKQMRDNDLLADTPRFGMYEVNEQVLIDLGYASDPMAPRFDPNDHHVEHIA